jgi:hypothetical protein
LMTGKRTTDRTIVQEVLVDTNGSIRVVNMAGTSASTGAAVSTDGVVAASTIGTDVRSFEYVFNGTTWDRVSEATGTGRLPSSAATTNATSVKATAGTLYSVVAYNTTAAVIYVKIYNTAGAPVVGTDTPRLTLVVPPNGTLDFNVGGRGAAFSTGISFATTTGAADADATAVGAGAIVGLNVNYS